jgi:hypothetical protein
MANLTITKCRLVVGNADVLYTAPVGEAGTAGQYFRLNTTTAKLEKGNGTTTGELGNVAGLLQNDESLVNVEGSIILLDSNAIVDLGDALDALAFNAAVYVSDTDATLADSAGTVSRVVGRVVAGHANIIGGTPDKLLMLRST